MNKTDALIIGAGPTGLFTAHQLKLIGLNCEIVDNLDKIGGQCIELYPDKPIYDIPGMPEILAGDLVDNLLEQIKPFSPSYTLGERAEKLIKKDDGSFDVVTNTSKVHNAKVVAIAGGLGSFEPRKPPIDNIIDFEGKGVEYMIKDPNLFKQKNIVIAGGGDSALDWAIELSNTSKINLIHRRDGFSGAESSVQKVKDLNDQGKLNLFTKYQMDSVSGDKQIETVKIKHDEGEIKEIKSDYVLGFFGLIMQLGPILDWGLNIDKKTVQVNTENFETNVQGIFAIGDICSYPGKLKLILSGFHEGALAARGCFKYAKPDEKLRFEFTTTSKAAQERLGIKK